MVHAEWLKNGATVCALGSYQEIDSRIALTADRIFVDNWEACRQRGNLAPVIQSGALTRDDIDGEVADLVAGKPDGGSSGDQTALIVIIGIGALGHRAGCRNPEAGTRQGHRTRARLSFDRERGTSITPF